MRYIKLIRNLVLLKLDGTVATDPETNKAVVLSTITVIEGRLADSQFGLTAEWLFASYEIYKCLRALKDSDAYLALEGDHWNKLVTVIDKPSPHAPHNPHMACGLVPVFKLITEATEEKPVVDDDATPPALPPAPVVPPVEPPTPTPAEPALEN